MWGAGGFPPSAMRKHQQGSERTWEPGLGVVGAHSVRWLRTRWGGWLVGTLAVTFDLPGATATGSASFFPTDRLLAAVAAQVPQPGVRAGAAETLLFGGFFQLLGLRRR